MREIAEILADKGPCPPVEVLPELRTWTVRSTDLHKVMFTPSVLRKKMDGRYACKAG